MSAHPTIPSLALALALLGAGLATPVSAQAPETCTQTPPKTKSQAAPAIRREVLPLASDPSREVEMFWLTPEGEGPWPQDPTRPGLRSSRSSDIGSRGRRRSR